jgi:hypothetical protein
MTDLIDPTRVGRGILRGRYDVLIPLGPKSYVRVTSRRDRSMTRAEIIAALRALCDQFDVKADEETPT